MPTTHGEFSFFVQVKTDIEGGGRRCRLTPEPAGGAAAHHRGQMPRSGVEPPHTTPAHRRARSTARPRRPQLHSTASHSRSHTLTRGWVRAMHSGGARIFWVHGWVYRHSHTHHRPACTRGRATQFTDVRYLLHPCVCRFEASAHVNRGAGWRLGGRQGDRHGSSCRSHTCGSPLARLWR